MKKYIIQFKVEIEVEAENKEDAQRLGEQKFQEIEEGKVVKVSDARVVDKLSGYYL